MITVTILLNDCRLLPCEQSLDFLMSRITRMDDVVVVVPLDVFDLAPIILIRITGVALITIRIVIYVY